MPAPLGKSRGPFRSLQAEQAPRSQVARRGAALDRSRLKPLKHYARLAMIAEDNPDLPLSMIQGILDAQAELKAGLAEPYRWGVLSGAAEISRCAPSQEG